MGFACTAGSSTATIGGSSTLEDENTARKAAGKGPATPSNSAAGNVAYNLGEIDEKGKSLKGLQSPTLTDTLLEEARKRMALQLQVQSDRRRALSGGSYGGASYSYSLLR
jgi:hypothetical protein